MKFREHRGGLAESMETTIELEDRAALIAHCRALLDQWYFSFRDEDLSVEPYGRDERIGWDTHIVTIKGYGVMGFTDGGAE